MLKEKKFKNLLTTLKSNVAFTLIEILMAVAIFATTVTVVSTIFVSSLRAQRQALAYQQLLDQTSYLIEYMSRAIRMAKKDMDGSCTGTGTAKLNYAFENQCLKFRNYQGKCQQFCLEGAKIKEIKEGIETDFLTSPDLSVTLFSVTDPHTPSSWEQPPVDYNQPLVKIFLEIEGKEQSKIQIQTSVSQRNLDFQR